MPISNPSTAGATNITPIHILPYQYSAIVQGTWVYLALATDSQWATFVWWNSTAANSDEINYTVYLTAGTYTIKTLYEKVGSLGIVKLYLDATEVDSIDQYAAANTYNQTSVVTGIALTSSKLYTLTLKIVGKNGASSGYSSRTSLITFIRTA